MNLHDLSAIIKYFCHLIMTNLAKSTKVDTSYKQIIQLSAPIWISILITQISFATNNYFLGHVGKSQLAANGVGSIFYLILVMVCYGFTNGVQVILSRRAGQEDKKGFGAVFSNSISLGLVFTAVIIALSLIIAPFLFSMQIQDIDIKLLATQFIMIRLWGLPFYFMQQMGNQFFISTQNSKYIMAGIIVSTIVNIVLDYAMINGHFGFAAMGIKGAAIASILAEVSYVLVSYGIIFYKKLNTIFDLHLFVALQKKLSVDTLRLASPVILQYFFSIGSWMLFYFYVEHLGKDELAISQVLRSVFGIVGAGSWAMASTCNTMVGNLMGQKKFDEIFTIIAKISLISFLLSLIFGTFYLLFPAQLFSIYTNDATLIAKAIAPMKVVVIANFLLAISTVVFNAVLGTGNTRMNVIIEFSAIIIYISYIHFVIETKHMSLSWAWGSEFFYWLSLLIMATSYLKWGKWREKIV
jgi:hypothetical protein